MNCYKLLLISSVACTHTCMCPGARLRFSQYRMYYMTSLFGICMGCNKSIFSFRVKQLANLDYSSGGYVNSVRFSSSSLHARLIHQASGRTYHETFYPPKVPMKDDVR